MHRLLISVVLIGLLVVIAWPTQATPPPPNGGEVNTVVINGVGQSQSVPSGADSTRQRVIALSTSDADVEGFTVQGAVALHIA